MGPSFDHREIVEAHRWLQKLFSFFWGWNVSLPKSCWGNDPWTCLSMKVKVAINMNSTFLWTDSNAYLTSYWALEQVVETWARSKECATPGPRVRRSDVTLEIHWFTNIQSKLRRICKLVNHDSVNSAPWRIDPMIQVSWSKGYVKKTRFSLLSGTDLLILGQKTRN